MRHWQAWRESRSARATRSLRFTGKMRSQIAKAVNSALFLGRGSKRRKIFFNCKQSVSALTAKCKEVKDEKDDNATTKNEQNTSKPSK